MVNRMDSVDAARPAHGAETELASILLERSAEVTAGVVKIVRERPVLVVGVGAAIVGAAFGSYLAGRLAARRRERKPWEPLLETAAELVGSVSTGKSGTAPVQDVSNHLGKTMRRAGYAADLALLAVRLLANPIVRELLRDLARRRLARYFAGRF